MFKDKPFQDWREGQTLYNFLAWMTDKGYIVGNLSGIGDPFYVTDEKMAEYYTEFLEFYKSKNLV